MSNKKLSLPASYGGIISYYDEATSKLMIKPEVVVILAILLIAVVFLMHYLGGY